MKSRFGPILLIFMLGGCAVADRPPYLPFHQAREYRLGAGDRIRVVVFDQPNLTATYLVDASGSVSVPLAGRFKAEGKTPAQVESSIKTALRDQNLVDDPKVSVEIASYRPFSILGEVRSPGRYPYDPSMTIEEAVALAGGYTLHADQEEVRVTTHANGEQVTDIRPPTATFYAGDTLYIQERWF